MASSLILLQCQFVRERQLAMHDAENGKIHVGPVQLVAKLCTPYVLWPRVPDTFAASLALQGSVRPPREKVQAHGEESSAP